MRNPIYEMELPYSEAGVRLLEDVPRWEDDGGKNGILEEMSMTSFHFEGKDRDERFGTIAKLFGSYPGEVLRRTCGGEWVPCGAKRVSPSLDDALLVRVLDGLADRKEQLQPLPRREVMLVAVFRDRHALDQVHDEVRPAGA